MTEGYKVAGGDRLGKTIIFAKNQKHAEFIEKRFNLALPRVRRRTSPASSPTARTYAQSLIDDFSIKDKAPHIAISVDMLDTGIDVPEVVNLVFFKMVRSKSKFWQMIGRGTRLCPDLFGPGEDKKDFFVFDFCGNLEYFSQDLPGSEGSLQKSLTQRLFEARLGLVVALDDAGAEPELRDSHRRLAARGRRRDEPRQLPRPPAPPGRRDSSPSADAWTTLDAGGRRGRCSSTSPACRPRSATTTRTPSASTCSILRRQLAQLDGDAVAAERLRETVQRIAAALLGEDDHPVRRRAGRRCSRRSPATSGGSTSPCRCSRSPRLRLRGLVRFVEKTTPQPGLHRLRGHPRRRASRSTCPASPPARTSSASAPRPQAYLREHEDHLALQRLRRNKQLTAGRPRPRWSEMLVASAAASRSTSPGRPSRAGGLGLFIRSLVGLDRAAATEAFADYLDGTKFSVDQVRFVNLIVDELTANGVMEPARLFESPYTDHAPTGPDYFFPDADVDVIVEILRDIKQHAIPAAEAS